MCGGCQRVRDHQRGKDSNTQMTRAQTVKVPQRWQKKKINKIKMECKHLSVHHNDVRRLDSFLSVVWKLN